MRRLRVALAAALSAALIAAAPGAALAARTQTAGEPNTLRGKPIVDTAYALVQLKGAPVSTYVKTKPPQGKKIDFASATTKSYRAYLSGLRNDFKAWLRVNAPAARITRGWDIALNAVSVKLNGTALAKLRTSPLVARVELQGLYYPTGDPADPDLAAIDTLEAWDEMGVTASTAGQGVKVAVIDSGIDATHPCFDDAGYPNVTERGDTRFTNDKVIVARVFNNKAVSRGYTAEAIDTHGTHVAGTIACNAGTTATVDGAAIPHAISGVAPRALLGNYNVFPGDSGSARSEDILNAMEAAYVDGFDIGNMSLGGGYAGIQDLLTIAVDNLDIANMVFAVSMGNNGPGKFTGGSPGSAARALTAGASAIDHMVTTYANVDGTEMEAALGEFGKPAYGDYPISGALDALTGSGDIGLNTACAALPAAPAAGMVAAVQRGVCDFTTKVRNVQAAGYAAAVVVNRVDGLPFPMGITGLPTGQPTIPAWMVAKEYVDELIAADGETLTVTAPEYVHPYGTLDAMADFSSQGPTRVDFRVKPDVVAPGENILSSLPRSACGGDPCFAFYSGTSMAAPHLAGVAALVKQHHPAWPAWAIRSAIVNTAETGVLTKWDLSGSEIDVNVSGAGRVNAESAIGASVVISPVSMSFGAVPSISGQTRAVRVTIYNPGGSSKTWNLAIAAYGGASGVAFSTSVSSVTVGAGQSASFSVIARVAKGAPVGYKQAWLTISDGATMVAHAAVFTLVK